MIAGSTPVSGIRDQEPGLYVSEPVLRPPRASAIKHQTHTKCWRWGESNPRPQMIYTVLFTGLALCCGHQIESLLTAVSAFIFVLYDATDA